LSGTFIDNTYAYNKVLIHESQHILDPSSISNARQIAFWGEIRANLAEGMTNYRRILLDSRASTFEIGRDPSLYNNLLFYRILKLVK